VKKPEKIPQPFFSKWENLFRQKTQDSPLSPAGGGRGWIFIHRNYLMLFIYFPFEFGKEEGVLEGEENK
jgi:hypothetical protein